MGEISQSLFRCTAFTILKQETGKEKKKKNQQTAFEILSYQTQLS